MSPTVSTVSSTDAFLTRFMKLLHVSIQRSIMGVVGAETPHVTLMSLGYAPKPSRLNLNFEDVELRESNGVHDRVKSCCAADDEFVIEEVLSEWWGCRALMQRIVDADELPEEETGDDEASGILSLPDDVMTMILAQLPRQSLAMARRVCSSWKRVAEQQELASLRRKVQIHTNFD